MTDSQSDDHIRAFLDCMFTSVYARHSVYAYGYTCTYIHEHTRAHTKEKIVRWLTNQGVF